MWAVGSHAFLVAALCVTALTRLRTTVLDAFPFCSLLVSPGLERLLFSRLHVSEILQDLSFISDLLNIYPVISVHVIRNDRVPSFLWPATLLCTPCFCHSSVGGNRLHFLALVNSAVRKMKLSLLLQNADLQMFLFLVK